MKCDSRIYLFLLLLQSVWCRSDGYRNQRLQDYLCADKLIYALQKPFKGDQALTLTEDRESAAIITQTWNSTMPGTYHASNKLKYDCHFRVQTSQSQPRGIYTVITRLKFRHDQNGACLDYIQFFNGNRDPSERICNDISIDGPAGRLIFDQRDRDVNVHIHIDKKHIIHEPLELRMVLTAHSECKYTGDFLCDPNKSYSCISRHFVRDNITNCMYPCRDEVSCFHDAITSEDVDATNVAISAITALIFTMLGVGFCVWICWKYWNCITVQQHAHEASAAAHRRGPTETPTVNVPAAPSIAEIFSASSVDQPQQQPPTPKDLPPSYESLFPDR